jgi:hypothetical protein
MHLNPDELVDLADGGRCESSLPHLAACADCRRQLAGMRAMMSAVADVDVPEPSPLFWDHLSARVGAAVTEEATPRFAWLGARSWRRGIVPAGAVAAASVLIVVALGSRLIAPPTAVHRSAVGSSAANLKGSPAAAGGMLDAAANRVVGADGLGDAAADASLMLVASLTAAMDLDAATDAGLAPSGSAEHAVTQMADDELRELQRLLKEEMVGS